MSDLDSPTVEGGPDIQALEDGIRERVRELNLERDQVAAAADERIAAAGSAIPTAGAPYEDQITAAGAQFDNAVQAYAAQLVSQQADLDDATTELDAIVPYSDQADAIAAIEEVTSPTLADNTVESLQEAFDDLTAKVGTMRGGFIDVLTGFNEFLANGNTAHLKAAVEKALHYAQTMQNTLPTSEDVEAEKTAALNELQGLFE